MEFSKKSAPCLLSRSILQCLYLPQSNTVFGTTPISDMLKESAKLFISPPVLMQRNAFASNPQVSINNKNNFTGMVDNLLFFLGQGLC